MEPSTSEKRAASGRTMSAVAEPNHQGLFVERFCQVAEQHGQRPAVIVGGQAVTYRRLCRQAKQIAAQLRDRVDPGDVVALQIEKSAEYVAAVIGAWMVRAAWLPLDPGLPEERRQFMLKDSGARCVLHRQGGQIVVAQSAARSGSAPPVELPSTECPSDQDLAWVIYTSGTTGRPRGVEVEHRGVIPLLDAQRTAFRIGPDSRCLWFYPTGFDASVSDLGTALLSGAALIVEPRLAGQPGPQELLSVLHEHQVTHADLPPALLPLLDESQLPACFDTVILGGQASDHDTVQRWVRSCRVINVYGPTETTVCSSLCEYTLASDGRALLGEPLPGTVYRVVDGDCAEVASGSSGELLIAGPGVARGYRNDADRTAEKFVLIDGCRWYRTGDRVRRDSDGRYVFLGRIDRQINHHGLRIEPAEIESLICRLPMVSDAAVIQRKITSESRHVALVAFVEASQQQVSEQQIRVALKRHLTGSRIPSRIVVVSALPRLSTGKTDFRTLQQLELPGSAAADNPGTDLQQTLLNLCRRVLGVPGLGLEESFFAAGGDSLAVIDLCALARAEGLDLPAAVVRDGESVAGICRRLRKAEHEVFDGVSSAWLSRDVAGMAEGVRQRSFIGNAPNGQTESGSTQVYLLTGATGFLGSRILEQLLRHDSGSVVCLVRAGARQEAIRRLQITLRDQQLQLSASQWQRVQVVCGDVSQPRCGLDEPVWDELQQRVTVVVHSAARVHSLADYGALRAVNVEAVAELLKLVTECQQQARLLHVSTLSVFAASDRYAQVHYEADAAMGERVLYGGYAQSKWAAEYLLRHAGIPEDRLSIVWPGLLTADTRTGVLPLSDILTLTAQGILAVGCVPDPVPDIAFDMTPVDFAARAVAQIALDPASSSVDCWHLAGPRTVTAKQLFRVLRQREPKLESVLWPEFQQRAGELCCSGDTAGRRYHAAAACLSLARWFRQDRVPSADRHLDLFQATGAQFDTRRTTEYLSRWGIECPVADDRLLEYSLQRVLTLAEETV